MSELAKVLRALAETLTVEAEKLDPVKLAMPEPSTNIFGPDRDGGIGRYVPQEFNFYTPDNPYGAHDSIGSPGWQVNLRSWAAADGMNRNTFVREKGLTPIWPDEKQPFEQ